MASSGASISIEPRSAQGQRFLIIEARYYADIANELLKGAIEALELAGAEHDVITVPGALEIPAAIAMALETGDYDGFIALGTVIRGETTHYEIVSGESARALMEISVVDALPLGNGILTVENEAQAWARARVNEQNKGGGAANAALAMAALKARLGEQS
ncbi:6,7-dimethyl-8-ribityllumazine synthase [Devosia rhodophyticola]|uniref:6,7-dimethyl-8-ribityllumazine synthase n=1 Tax=Devosia rhodophyticola TaxID=3026423 RepID=A0ABY7YYJ6_9HYPH|nr:6,7-dimethyl-8-ribityllumazine synthase [Devosia rhodophyticola]WDR06085.1 6,7-dimethyl-8-ribityllumazine synthase [Devosia rhodophyticola]